MTCKGCGGSVSLGSKIGIINTMQGGSYLVLVFHVGGLAQPIFRAVLPDRLQGLKPEPVMSNVATLFK